MSTNPTPQYDFIAYIDEAGDDGLRAVKPLTRPGSSEWLIISAVVIRAANEPVLDAWVNHIRSSLGNRQTDAIHFSKLAHWQKVVACQSLSSLDLRCFVVASNKKNMQGYRNPDAEQVPSNNWFYCWMTRLMLERVTHFVAEKSKQDIEKAALEKDREQAGRQRLLKIEYSARGGLRYSQMKAYYEWIRLKRHRPFLPWGHIEFDYLDHRLMEVYPHYVRPGLQFADIVASAFFKACDKYDTGACNPEYAKLLFPRMARHPDRIGGELSGYGVKLLPAFRKALLDADQAEIFTAAGYPAQWWDPKAFS